MDVTAPDGGTWRVFRRRLAWRPRLPRWIVQWWPEGWPDDSIIGVIVGIYATLLLIIMSPFLLWYLLSWLLALLATPVAWLARSALGRPTPVVAYRKDTAWAEWTGTADGSRQADDLVRHTATEISRQARPITLSPPPHELLDLTTTRETPIMERLLARRRGRRGPAGR